MDKRIRLRSGVIPEVKPLKRIDIARGVHRQHARFYPDHLHTPQPVPIADFFDFVLPNEYGIRVGASDELPHGIEGIADPNNLDGEPELILADSVYENLLNDNPRARFTAAHESGHGLLHIKQIRTLLVEGGPPALYRREQLPAFRNPEWQANFFASCFLMPTTAVQAFVRVSGEDAELMAETFAVSYTAADIRLRSMKEMGLL